ncbi:MAG: flavodoxin family protein [Desulfatiglandaceae bacterium]
MGEKGFVLGLVGSPNPEGRTNELVTAALAGADRAGIPTELVQMSDHIVEACKDCLPWVCQDNQKCTYEDEALEYLSKKILNCGALILGTPVYWWDTSGMVKYLILKMFRIYALSAPLQGLPAFGISIAGGTGNGLISGLRQVYHFFQMMQMRALDPVPATRFNFNAAVKRAGELGTEIAGMAQDRVLFSGLEERLLWYDALPYLGLSRFEERRLLASLTTLAVPGSADVAVSSGLARAVSLAAAGHATESLTEITRVYEAGVEAFEGING